MNYNIDELIRMAEQDTHTIVIRSGASNCSMSIVYNVNGKRISFSKSLAAQLGITNEIYLLPIKDANTLILSAKPIGRKSSVGTVTGEGKKICYSAQLCKALVEIFKLDYDHATSLSFRDISFDIMNDEKVAIVNMMPVQE